MKFRKERCTWNQIIMQMSSQGLEGLMQIVTLFTFHSLEETMHDLRNLCKASQSGLD